MDVIGWSLGGCLALSTASAHPALFRSMTLVSTSAVFDETVFDRTMELHGELSAHADYLDILFPGEGPIAKRISAGVSMDVLGHYYDLLGGFDLSSKLESIQTSTLIVHGDNDCVTREQDLALLRRIPNAEVIRFDHDGHFIPLTSPRKFNELVTAFLERSMLPDEGRSRRLAADMATNRTGSNNHDG
jgi:pimeloyl-ACP methyl ester carboxylesterase